eukprot:12685203-Prorocentrum_lima.AAC.1
MSVCCVCANCACGVVCAFACMSVRRCCDAGASDEPELSRTEDKDEKPQLCRPWTRLGASRQRA